MRTGSGRSSAWGGSGMEQRERQESGAPLQYGAMEKRLEQIILQAATELEAEGRASEAGSKERAGGAAAEPSAASARGADAPPAAGAGRMGDKRLAALIRAANRGFSDNADHIAKKHLMPFYLRIKAEDLARWESWGIDGAVEQELLRLLQVKPRRTASGVATVAVITKPWPCASDCLYCPNDLRMPKSYLADEPACQRAERNWFDPYLQAASRLRALSEMGHVTDKVELIVLGGSWTDYPASYRRWFAAELFRALNEAGGPQAEKSIAARRERYEQAGIPHDEEGCARFVADLQRQVDERSLGYNQAFARLYGESPAWTGLATWQQTEWDEVERQQAVNEDAACRVVGLVVETRPDAVRAATFAELRRLGCTKVQMGIQSLDERILSANRRFADTRAVRRAFELARLFGFKTHAHFMANLLGATPEADKRDYRRLMADAAIAPDEVKLYPCALVAGTDLVACCERGAWQPYDEAQLTDVLASDLLETPAYTRVSRMIRDIPAQDILTGNKKINLRQMVEAKAARRAAAQGRPVREIRHREISVAGTGDAQLELSRIDYATTVSDEAFLQWVTPEGRIAGFLRLSLPHAEAIEQARREALQDAAGAVEANAPGAAAEADAETGRAPGAAAPFPLRPGEAMIREVHVYGQVAGLHRTSGGAQHRGLGRALVERACAIARERGCVAVNVISAVGTRGYYRSLGFTDNGLYQRRTLQDA